MLDRDNRDDERQLRRASELAKQEMDSSSRVQTLDGEGRARATGKRKEAIARVWIRPGAGEVTVNNRPLGSFFSVLENREQARGPPPPPAALLHAPAAVLRFVAEPGPGHTARRCSRRSWCPARWACSTPTARCRGGGQPAKRRRCARAWPRRCRRTTRICARRCARSGSSPATRAWWSARSRAARRLARASSGCARRACKPLLPWPPALLQAWPACSLPADTRFVVR